ncbi:MULTISPECIES: hypothetical protein [Methylobacterium]|jgi:uncharacterized membrane protein YphA (DoxX/SURF4 family)|uniref:hypothetical protein n=1 Tax=Methylobacterium TaxID=407 RepID=UPI00034B08CF|nr:MULTISPECIES: hypothetical protein [Methylobacterium]KQS81947.1 hypothetical protein ASG32_04175 [Methylobacterium sp. Leaf361]MBN4094399.1 hypothetical protein [Methylobacterium sp. OT2]UIN33184.1 hypothetical protein LXM90_19065 [Methylobacterium oryzae]SEG24914.1 hypothetical protein SAMN04488144_11243 [Methylobacterium sp. 190mf]SEH75535.1 hypothetical protein SAMN02799636_03722 [Methylobacterium sp. 275MFSha3.1]
MRTGRRFSLFSLPIDPWPQASLAERTAVGMVLTGLLLVPACAVGAALLVFTTLAAHVYWSYDLGASLHAFIARHAGAAVARRGRLVHKA